MAVLFSLLNKWTNELCKGRVPIHDKYLQSILPVEAGWNGHTLVRTLKLIIFVKYAQIFAVQLQSWATQREMLQEHAVKTCFQGCGITHNVIYPYSQPSVTACWNGMEMNLKFKSSCSRRRLFLALSAAAPSSPAPGYWTAAAAHWQSLHSLSPPSFICPDSFECPQIPVLSVTHKPRGLHHVKSPREIQTVALLDYSTAAKWGSNLHYLGLCVAAITVKGTISNPLSWTNFLVIPYFRHSVTPIRQNYERHRQ